MDNLNYYKASLLKCENNIKNLSQHTALKDVVGSEYEKHTARIYTFYGNSLELEQQNNQYGFTIDILVKRNGKILCLEETKGHYLDSCFMERALVGFSKAVHNLKTKGLPIPKMVIHSFTTYNKYTEKLHEFKKIVHPNIISSLDNNLIYITLCSSNRLHKKKWFTKNCDHPYLTNIDDNKILNHIRFISSL